MMGLYFLILVAVGILRPVRNALALESRAEGDFYQVYMLSALVILFAPVFNHLADRVRWRTLIPATAGFFALNLFAFRAVYSEGNTTFGFLFYGWYDLFAAALITQFFMAVQVFFNARDAKAAIPWVIAAGSMGAVSGGVLTGRLAPIIGTANMMLLAASFVTVFAVALPFLWTGYPSVRAKSRRASTSEQDRRLGQDFLDIFSSRHLRLIAGLVLITVLVKQIVDFEFQEAVRVFLGGDTDAISSFQGYVFAVKDFLPIVVLLPLGPLLKRYGIGLAVLMLPVFMLGSTVGLAVAFGVWTATVAKVGDSMFRYSAERTARELLYVPVPTELKLKAKAYIDAAVEKGLGKALSAVLIGVFSAFMDYRSVTWLAVGLALVWCYMAWLAKQQYVSVLADSIRGRFANLEGGFASLTERSTLAMVEAALRSDDTTEVGFGLDLVEQAGTVDAKHLADELELLLEHPDEEVRLRSVRLLARFPELTGTDVIRGVIEDESGRVAEAAVGALRASYSDARAADAATGELLDSSELGVRIAALSWMLHADVDATGARRLATERVEALLPNARAGAGLSDAVARSGVGVRKELAVASGLLEQGPLQAEILTPLLTDPDEMVSGSAIASVGRGGSTELRERLVSMLGDPSMRGRTKEGLVSAGPAVVELCARRLGDATQDATVRGRLAQVLAHVPEQRSVTVLQDVLVNSECPWQVRYASLKALSKLRSSEGTALDFNREAVLKTANSIVEEADRYLLLGATLERASETDGAATALLRGAAWEAWGERREAVFRLLGLVFDPDDVYRSHGTLGGEDDRTKANALEWLERTLGHAVFGRVLPVLDGRPSITPATARGGEGFVQGFAADPDPWIALLVGGTRNESTGGDGLDVIGKAFLLQKVDLLEGARSAHLGLLASIAEEIEADAGEILVQAGEPNEALYIVVRGSAELSGVGDQTLTAEDGSAFGTWSLIDSAPSVVGARALERTRLLRITRSDFQELVGDHPELATGMLQALARRFRSLVA
jgi:AAA family ATP:ADP antiporter